MMNNFDIPEELYDIVADACLYNENVNQAILKYFKSTKKCTPKEAAEIHKAILKDPKFKERMDDCVKVEKAGLFEDDRETILLKLNRIIRDANAEGKYDTVVKTLDRIAKMLSIEDKQTEFHITWFFKPTQATNLKMIKEELENIQGNTDKKA